MTPPDPTHTAVMASERETPVHRVSIKPPAFMETAVQGWFAVMDAQFHIAGITVEATKFYHVLSALPPDTIAHIPQVTLTSTNFKELQQVVTDMYEKTKPELFERLISKTRLTGRPSLFLCELREVADKVGVGDDLIRHKFVQSLPSSIAPVLASQRDLSLSQLGKLADELVPLVQGTLATVNVANDGEPQRSPGASQHQFPCQSPPCHTYEAPQRGFPAHDSLPCHFASPQPRQPQANYHRYPAQAREAGASGAFQGLTPFHEGQRPKVCRAHLFFGAQARTCKPWCQWPSRSANLRVQPSSRSASPARVPPSPQGN